MWVLKWLYDSQCLSFCIFFVSLNPLAWRQGPCIGGDSILSLGFFRAYPGEVELPEPHKNLLNKDSCNRGSLGGGIATVASRFFGGWAICSTARIHKDD